MSTPQKTPQTQQQVPQELTQQQALELLVSGVQAAQQKGAYNLNEAELLARACRVFLRQQTQGPTPQGQEALQTPVPQPPQTSQSSSPPVNDPQNVQTI